MDHPRATTGKPATQTAGSLLIAAIVLFAALGFVVGRIVGATAVPTVVGGFLGIVVGFTLVYRRFKNL
jgi:F0F1-type ATP synthase assembly protein I